VNQHEQAFVTEFISSARRDRFILLLSSPKQRRKFRDRIAHALIHDLDPRYAHHEGSLPANLAGKIDRLFRKVDQSGARCSVMCEDESLDGREMTFAEAEARWDALCGILISVVPGKLVVYRPERPNDNYLLFKE
jgi:hypothetical protein